MERKNNKGSREEVEDGKLIVNLDNSPQSSFYLGSSDSSSNTISPVILNGDNYVNWSHSTINGLRSKNKVSIVDGTVNKPQTSSLEYYAWERCSLMVIAWLYNIIENNLHGSVAYAETRRKIWTDLEERFSQSNKIRVHQLKRELTLTTQRNVNVADYFTKLKTQCDELGNCQPLRGCTYGASKDLSKHLEEEKVHQFWMSLDLDVWHAPLKHSISRCST